MAENWPKGYLLSIYTQAIESGFLWIKPITEAAAASLTQSFYRLRRRSDKSHASFILPEYHLVTIGKWEPHDNGRLPVIYSRLPDNVQLPDLVIPSEHERPDLAQYTPRVHMRTPPNPPALAGSLSEADILAKASTEKLSDDDIESYVEKMMRAAREKTDGGA